MQQIAISISLFIIIYSHVGKDLSPDQTADGWISLKTNADNALAFHSFNGQLTLDMRQEICHSCEPCVGPISPDKLDP